MKLPITLILIITMSTWCIGETDVEAGERWYQCGLESLKQGKLEKAERSFKWALRYNPDHANAQQGLAIMEQRQPEIEAEKKILNGHTIRFVYGSVPGLESETIEDYDSDVTEADGSWQFELLYVKRNFKSEESRLGWLIGGGWFVAFNAGEDEDGEDYDGLGFGFICQAGGAVRVGEHLVFELSPYAGFGSAILGTYGLYGIKGGAHLIWKDLGLGVGVEVGYQAVDIGVASGSGTRVAGVVSLNF